jgi:hypothetical protein
MAGQGALTDVTQKLSSNRICLGRGPIANIDAIGCRKRHRDLYRRVSGNEVVPDNVTFEPKDENDPVRISDARIVLNHVVVGATKPMPKLLPWVA